MATHIPHYHSSPRGTPGIPTYMQQAQAKQLTDLIHRLEAATSRLEDIASSAHEDQAPQASRSIAPSGSTTTTTNGESQSAAPRAQAAPPAKLPLPEQTIELPESVQAFDTMMNEDLKPFVDLSEKVGGLVAEQVSVL